MLKLYYSALYSLSFNNKAELVRPYVYFLLVFSNIFREICVIFDEIFLLGYAGFDYFMLIIVNNGELFFIEREFMTP